MRDLLNSRRRVVLVTLGLLLLLDLGRSIYARVGSMAIQTLDAFPFSADRL